MSDADDRADAPPRMVLLWFAVLGAPLAWSLGFNTDYALVRLACAKESMLYLHLATLFSLGLSLCAGWVAYAEWRRAGKGALDEAQGPASLAGFMAILGLLGSAFFSLLIVAQWLPNLFLHPCMGI
jgi:hypothetical protein